MTTIYAMTTDQILSATICPKVASGNQNTVYLSVEFDEPWDGYTKSALFYTDKNPTVYECVLSTTGKCIVPVEVLVEKGYLFITLKGVKVGTDEIKATSRLRIKIVGGTPSMLVSDPTDDVYNQLLALYGVVGEEVAVERARINALTKLSEGSTTGDAELQDIRIGSNGNAYETAGEAVRTQYGKAAARLDDLTIPSKNLFDKRFAVKGKFLEYTNTGNTYDIEGFFVSDYIPVKGNTTYNINYTDAAKIISQYDATLTHISSVTAWSITTAENAKYIRFSTAIENIDTTMFVEGTLPTEYIPYAEKINYSVFEDNGLDGDAIKSGTIRPSKLKGYRVTSHNLFNPNTVLEGVYLYYANGGLKEFEGYFVSDYIEVKPSTVYSATSIEQLGFYDKDGKFLEKLSAVEGNFTTPQTAYFIRISDNLRDIDVIQINEGETLQPYDNFTFVIDDMGTRHFNKLYTLGKAWNEWATNKKFPIGILGDSTTDGASTTGWTSENGHENLDKQNGGFGSVDYINKNAYPYKLEQLIRAELNNDNMRVYNIGYSGYSFYTIMSHYDEIFSGAYSDVKMVGINMGINDRVSPTTPVAYYDNFRKHLIETVEYLYNRGIQPFIITSQATVEPYPDDSLGAFYPLRTSEYINSVANRIKYEVAREYGLEIVDMTAFDEFVMSYSKHKISDIINDELHFRDLGHTLEAEFLFSELSPRTVKVTHGTNLDFSNQHLKSECPSNKITHMTAPVEKMKVSVNYEKSDTNDIVLQDFIINVTEKSPLCLTAYCSEVGSQYVVIDDVVTKITRPEHTVKILDVGIHRIKAMSGESNKVSWIGFRLTSKEYEDVLSRESRNNKRLVNVEQGEGCETTTDDTTAYTKTVPETAHPYAKISMIGGATRKSVNLFDESQISYAANSLGVTSEAYGVVQDGVLIAKIGLYSYGITWKPFAMSLGAGTYTISADCYISTGGAPNLNLSVRLVDAETNASVPASNVSLSAFDNWERISAQITLTESSEYMLSVQGGGNAELHSNMDVRFKNICVAEGDVAEYSSYFEGLRSAKVTEAVGEGTLTIPEAVKALDGYGEGVDESTYNFIEWGEDGKRLLNRRVKTVEFDGNEEWYKDEVGNTFWTSLNNFKKSQGTVLSNRYTCNIIDVLYVSVASTGVSTVEEFKAILKTNPLYVVYILDTPDITDISDILPADNFIAVESGGTVTMVNEYEYDVPNTITF